MAKMKKYQGGGNLDPRVAAFLKKRAASDTTKKYNRGEMLETINAITAGKIKPRVDKPMASGQGTKKYATVSGKDTTYMSKADFEKKYAQKKDGGKIKKAKSGGSFPDLNKDGKITKADILKGRGVIAKKEAKNGTKIKKAQNGDTTQIQKPSDKATFIRRGSSAGRMPTLKSKQTLEGSKRGVSMMSKGGKMKMGGKCKNGC